MKKIVVGFKDYFYPMDQFFMDILSREYEVERDDDNPEYLFFCDDTFGRTKYNYTGNAKKIFFTGENVRPSNCHFALSFDHSTDDRQYRLPLYVLDNWVNEQLELPYIDNSGRTANFSLKRLCPYNQRNSISFLVKNSNCDHRNKIFDLINNQYAHIDSGGPWKNTVGYQVGTQTDPNYSYIQPWNGKLTKEIHDFQWSKYEFLRRSKVNLCYENASYPGYVTEKLYHAIVYGTVPAYWGSPTVNLDFNPMRFLCRHDYYSDAQFAERIMDFLENMQTWIDKKEQPVFASEEQLTMSPLNIDRLLYFFNKAVII